MDFLPFALTAILCVIIAVINHKKDYKRYALLIGLTAIMSLVVFYNKESFRNISNVKDCLIMSINFIFILDYSIDIIKNSKKNRKQT